MPKRRHLGDHRGAELVEAVERQRLADKVGQRAEDRPVLACVARREDRALAALHPAFDVDIGAMLFGIGRARQDQVGAGCALVAMMADIDLERALEAVGRDFVRAEQDHQLRLGLLDVGDAALLAHSRAAARPSAPRRCAAR